MLVLDKVSVCYGPITALKEVSLNVPSGAIVSLIGSNGAGKSTCVKSISGMTKLTGGKVSFEGEDISTLSTSKRLEKGISCVMEGRRIFGDQTVLDNLLLGAYVRRKQKKEIRCDIERLYELFPILRTRSKQIAGTLSGGEQQILALARALISKPRLLLMDEPSLGLAPKMIEQMYEYITYLNKQDGLTILLVEQFASFALQVSSYCYVFERGRIAVAGEPDTLKHDSKIADAYFGGTST